MKTTVNRDSSPDVVSKASGGSMSGPTVEGVWEVWSRVSISGGGWRAAGSDCRVQAEDGN